jgi:hypothetical protein
MYCHSYASYVGFQEELCEISLYPISYVDCVTKLPHIDISSVRIEIKTGSSVVPCPKTRKDLTRSNANKGVEPEQLM